MTSKHCPDKDNCSHAGSCQSCAHGRQYEWLDRKIKLLLIESKRFKQELAQTRQALMTCPGTKEAAP